MKTFEHKNKEYTIKNGFLYEIDKGLVYTTVSKGTPLEAIALNHGFEKNIEDSIGDGFHSYYFRKNHYTVNGKRL